jgi:hypothetical protein
MNAALEFQVASVLDDLAIGSSGWNEIVRLEDIRIALRSHVCNVSEVVEQWNDAATKFRDLREGVHFAASVGRDESLADLQVGAATTPDAATASGESSGEAL